MRRLIGVDQGWGYTKVVTGNRAPLAFQSVIAPVRERHIVREGPLLDNLHVRLERDGSRQEFFAGTLAVEENGGDLLIQEVRPWIMELTLTALGLVANDGDDVHLCLGLPITEHRKYGAELQQKLPGLWDIMYIPNPHGKRIPIRSAIVMPEGLGVLYGVMFEQGRIVRPELQDGQHGIIDIGMGTVNVFAVRDLRYLDSLSDTYMGHGMIEVLLKLRAWLHDTYGLSRRLSEVDSMLRAGELVCDGRRIGLRWKLQELFDEQAETVYKFVSQKWQSEARAMESIIVAGKGGELLAEHLRKRCKAPIIVAPDAQYANARGFYEILVLDDPK